MDAIRVSDIPKLTKEVSACLAWIDWWTTKRKTYNREAGSYKLKHAVEKWCGFYVSEKDFWRAAEHMKCKERVLPSGNIIYAMSLKRAIKDSSSGFKV